MTYGRNPRYGGREGTAPDWRDGGRPVPTDWRTAPDDPRVASADQAVGTMIDLGYFETVGLAPDGDLLLRLTDKGWDADRVILDDGFDPGSLPAGAPPSRNRSRPRRRPATQPADSAE